MPPLTKEMLKTMLRLRHGEVIRRGKPRLGPVTADGVTLIIDVDPIPSYQWWTALAAAAEGTVLEGRVTGQGSQVSVQTVEDELAADVHRVDDLLRMTNAAYEQTFVQARRQLEELDAQANKGSEEDVMKRRLEDRLKGF